MKPNIRSNIISWLFRHPHVGELINIHFKVIGGTSGETVIWLPDTPARIYRSEPGEAMTENYHDIFQVTSETRYSFCVETTAAGASRKACAHCDVIPRTLPTLRIHVSDGFQALAKSSVSLSVVNVTGNFIRGLDLTVQWGDGSPTTLIHEYDPKIMVEHAFVSAGRYEVVAFLTGSQLKPFVLKGSMHVYPNVEKLWCAPLSNRHLLTPGETLTFTVFVHASGTFDVQVEGEDITVASPFSITSKLIFAKTFRYTCCCALLRKDFLLFSCRFH